MARAARRQARLGTPPTRLVLDAGAVIAWSRGAVRARALLRRAIEVGMDVRVPVGVLAEVLRGGPRDAPVHRVLKAVSVFPTPDAVGRLAGTLLGSTGGTNTLDALVAAEAVLLEADVLTSDSDDLCHLLETHPSVAVHSV